MTSKTGSPVRWSARSHRGLEEAEIERTKLKKTENLDAYERYLRGMGWVCSPAPGMATTRRSGSSTRTFRLDPGFATAYGMAARTYVQRNSGGWMRDRAREIAETERVASKAVEHGRDDAFALTAAGFRVLRHTRAASKNAPRTL